MNKTNLIFIIIGLTTLISCSTTYSDKFGKIDSENVIRVEFTSAVDSLCIVYKKKHEHTDPEIIERFIGYLNNSVVEDQLWKGDCWDKINIIKRDTTITFSFNTLVFGNAENGIFFKFPKEEN